MAKSTTKETAPDSPMAFTEEQLAAHQADMARRRAEHEAKLPVLDACLDPRVAAEYELRKPVYRWRVWAKFRRHLTIEESRKRRMEDSDDTSSLTLVEEEREVVAQNEQDAWAKFCDKIHSYPTSKAPTQRRFDRLEQVDPLVLAAIDQSAQFPGKL